MLGNREGLVGELTVAGHLGLSDREVFNSKRRKEGFTKTATLDFCGADFGLLRRLIANAPWQAVLKGRFQKGWALLKKEIFKVQKVAIPICQKTSQQKRSLAWLNGDLWLEPRDKIRIYGLWKQREATQKEAVKLCRQTTRRAKAQLQLNPATAIKDNKKVSTNTLPTKARLGRIFIFYWMQEETE